MLQAGLINSTGVLELVAFLEGHFDIAVADAEIVPQNLDTIDALAAFVSKKVATAAPGRFMTPNPRVDGNARREFPGKQRPALSRKGRPDRGRDPADLRGARRGRDAAGRHARGERRRPRRPRRHFHRQLLGSGGRPVRRAESRRRVLHGQSLDQGGQAGLHRQGLPPRRNHRAGSPRLPLAREAAAGAPCARSQP